MKTKYFCLLLFLLPVIGCDREGSLNPAINLVSSSVCKEHGLKTIDGNSSGQDCIQYAWVTGDTLKIKHINAGFNCCPQGFQVKLKMVVDTLVITESENSNLCDCNCLFDLSYTVTGISKDNWCIRVEEPYIQQPEQKKILFRADLDKTPEGSFCIARTGYPWGT